MNQKTLGIIAGMFITLAVLGTFVFVSAQGSVDNSSKYIDEDNDGVCDYAQSGNCPYKDQVGEFIDADGDGVCDNINNCSMHQNGGRCHGAEGCPYAKASKMNCHG